MKTNAREIGSEFDYRNEFLNEKNNSLFESGLLTYSGRTAIGVAISDILKTRKIGVAWLPSYSCESMAQPFYDLGIKVEFYSVSYDFKKNKIVREDFEPCKNDVVLTMGYFGFGDAGNIELVKKCRDKGIIVIEDGTHSLLSHTEFLADYRVSSLRKWFAAASGGFVQKRDGTLDASLNACDRSIVDMRILAMKEKMLYLESEPDESLKSAFLEKYRIVNQSFSKNYKNLAIDEWSASILRKTDVEKIRQRRRENAQVLLDALCGLSGIRSMFDTLDSYDCPLFVPILCENRAGLQKKLAENKIYCPTHWPKHSDKANSNFYDFELSLICDHRYLKDDMERILKVVKES